MKKVKECSGCGQGFDEDNNPVGKPIPSTRCTNGMHSGEINRIVFSNAPIVCCTSSLPLPILHPYIRRYYVLYQLNRPEGMLLRGLRDYILETMRDQPICGAGYRCNLEGYGKCVIVRACGNEETLAELQLWLHTQHDQGLWDWDMSPPNYPDTTLLDLPAYDFVITQPGDGARCGSRSNPNKNKSEKSSRTGHSSQTYEKAESGK